MSPSARPSLASTMLVAAGLVWCALIVINIMMVVDHVRFVGNPFYTLLVGAAITLTGLGHRQRCFDQLAAMAATFRRPILRTDVTGEIPRAKTHAGTAVVQSPDELDRYAQGFVDGLAKPARRDVRKLGRGN